MTERAMIANHYAARLSPVDMQMALAVPPGGNWKNIPESVPSDRLDGIRKAYAAGMGSRSTYYGRLRPDEPAYTINTYFNRPGNGCHLHYDYEGGQHRVLSQREAARLQSFPDSFVFLGSRASVNKQIGNAVPPLLAYQIAKQFPDRGQFVDLFSGAGGLSLGFTWAGWESIVANDIDPSFLTTYRANIHDSTICGDIRDTKVFQSIVERVTEARKGKEHLPLLVLGGPPCQGFSTAGLRRSMEDERNHLFREYRAMLLAMEPLGLTGFVFENVAGLLNMEGGAVFAMVKKALETTSRSLSTWMLRTEGYAVPQRRTRIFIIGYPLKETPLQSPSPITEMRRRDAPTLALLSLARAVTTEDALSDLPALNHGEDGSHLAYRTLPQTPFQALMRGLIGPEDYLVGTTQVGFCGVVER